MMFRDIMNCDDENVKRNIKYLGILIDNTSISSLKRQIYYSIMNL